MATTTTTSDKREASDELTSETKRLKPNDSKKCTICNETGTTFPQISKKCRKKHTNAVCQLCWNKYICVEVLEHGNENVRCVQFTTCKAYIIRDDLKRITSAKNLEHYDWLVRRNSAIRNGERVCVADVVDAGGNTVACEKIQVHAGGRVFQCSKCGDRECVPCGVREHSGESCDSFQARLVQDHGDEEELTVKALAEGYYGNEVIGKKGNTSSKWKVPKPCGKCGVLIERMDKCPHLTCAKCANQFCIKCDAPYFGLRGVYKLGNAAHQEGCVYRGREKEDRRCKRKKRVSPTPKALNTAKAIAQSSGSQGNGEGGGDVVATST